MDMLKRDRFELLSAYLDGEVTAAERQQVETWLANDPEIQLLYVRLLKLRQCLRTMPTPPQGQPVERTVEQVFARIDRTRTTGIWGGGAIAALIISALLGVIPSQTPVRVAKSPQPQAATETLMVALNTPVIDIPKAVVPAKVLEPTFPQPTTSQSMN